MSACSHDMGELHQVLITLACKYWARLATQTTNKGHRSLELAGRCTHAWAEQHHAYLHPPYAISKRQNHVMVGLAHAVLNGTGGCSTGP
jgi:hypothetical protein